MMKRINYCLVVLGFVFLAGCTSTGVKVESNQVAKLQKGVTTEQEVVAMLGKPTAITVLPDRKYLHYNYQMSDQMGRSAASSAAAIVGGMIAGPLGSMAGSMAGNSMTANSARERLSIELDPKTMKVINYRHEKSQTGG